MWDSFRLLIPPIFKAGFVIKLLGVFFPLPKLIAFSEDFIAVTLHRTLNIFFYPSFRSLPFTPLEEKKIRVEFLHLAEISLLKNKNPPDQDGKQFSIISLETRLISWRFFR